MCVCVFLSLCHHSTSGRSPALLSLSLSLSLSLPPSSSGFVAHLLLAPFCTGLRRTPCDERSRAALSPPRARPGLRGRPADRPPPHRRQRALVPRRTRATRRTGARRRLYGGQGRGRGEREEREEREARKEEEETISSLFSSLLFISSLFFSSLSLLHCVSTAASLLCIFALRTSAVVLLLSACAQRMPFLHNTNRSYSPPSLYPPPLSTPLSLPPLSSHLCCSLPLGGRSWRLSSPPVRQPGGETSLSRSLSLSLSLLHSGGLSISLSSLLSPFTRRNGPL